MNSEATNELESETERAAPTVPQYIYDSLLRSYEAERGMRTDSARLIGIEMRLEEILAELKRSNSVAREGAVSSIQIEDHPTKDRLVRVTTKQYTGSVLDVEEALERHAFAHVEAERRALAGWAETVNGVAAPA